MGSDISLSKAVRANLLSLQNTAEMMNKTQSRLATGNKVNSALDNPSNFFTASALNSRAADMSNLLDSMASGIKVIEAANNGITALTKNLESMQSTLRQARQDKTFQTKSFEVSDNSVIKIGGGQYGDSVSTISLAAATVPGEKAQLTTDAATAYLGPQSTASSATGSGARSVITLNGGLGENDVFSVAGVDVTVTGAAPTADSIVQDIRTALASDLDASGKYNVFVGEAGSANDGKIIIETIKPSDAAATVSFGTGSEPATKGSTTFNYSAVNSSITAGGQTIATGATFEDFVENLRNGQAEGDYTVEVDSTTKQITLTSTEWGGAAPTVTGVPVVAAAIGTTASTTFQLSNGTGALSTTQDLTIGGASGPISLTSGMTNTQVRDALLADTDLAELYNIDVDADFNVSLTEKTVTNNNAPTVSTSAALPAAALESSHTGVGGLDFVDAANADANLQTLNGTTITLSDGTNTVTYAIDGTSTVSALEAALNADGFTVEATANGLNFSRADGANFSITTSGSNNDLGLGNAVTNVTNGTPAQAAGITGGNPATLTAAAGLDFVNAANADANLQTLNGTTITLSDGTNTVTYAIDGTSTVSALEAALNADGFTVEATANGFNFSRADGTNFSLNVTGTGDAADLGFGATSVTSNNGTQPTITSVDGEITTAAVTTGQVVTNPSVGASVETVAAEKDQFTVSYGGKTANVSISGVMGGADSAPTALDIKNWQDATVIAVNTQLETAGIIDVEAKFDTDGKFSLVAKTAEAKTLAISGTDAVSLFGTNGVNTGVAEKSELNSTKTVDKFVELINRDHAGKVRASNDNGKLRIENLSTQELEVGVDLNGNDAVNTLKIEGNSVRANLSKQFNELRDQLDKLSDDASFNGINLLRGDKLKITFNESGNSSIDIQAKDKNGNVRGINASNLNIDSLVAEDLDTDEKIDAFLAKLSSALTELRSQASTFGSNLSSVENRQSFTKSMINTLETGAANLTLADTNEEAANLLALQTRQQLSSSALSMASQQDQAVLQLLR